MHIINKHGKSNRKGTKLNQHSTTPRSVSLYQYPQCEKVFLEMNKHLIISELKLCMDYRTLLACTIHNALQATSIWITFYLYDITLPLLYAFLHFLHEIQIAKVWWRYESLDLLPHLAVGQGQIGFLFFNATPIRLN